MADELVLHNPQALKDRVSETVRATFGMLIPEAEWAKLVEKEVRAFFDEETRIRIERVEERGGDDYWRRQQATYLYATITPFREAVWIAVKTIVDAKLGAKLQTDEWLAKLVWPEDGTFPDAELGAALERKLEEIAPRLARELFRSIIGTAAEKAKNELREELRQSRL